MWTYEIKSLYKLRVLSDLDSNDYHLFHRLTDTDYDANNLSDCAHTNINWTGKRFQEYDGTPGEINLVIKKVLEADLEYSYVMLKYGTPSARGWRCSLCS